MNQNILSTGIAIACLSVTAACAPQTLQSSQVIGDRDGRPVYLLSGYTDAGEVEKGSSIKHAKFAMEDICPDGTDILYVNERKTGNITADFLKWAVKAQCK